MSKILLAGEQVTSHSVEIKGFDCFNVNDYKEDGSALYDALNQQGHTVDWMKTNQVAKFFPESQKELSQYDIIIFSDVGSNSLLLHPEVVIHSVPRPNRLDLIEKYVDNGGGFMMVGGWMSFSGIEAKAHYHDTIIEEILPVTCLPYDDRVEKPEGIVPTISMPNHSILSKLSKKWPFFLGYNKVTTKKEAEEVLSFDKGPLLSVWNYGQGKTAAFTSDCAPHWGPREFLDWESYGTFWSNIITWLAQ